MNSTTQAPPVTPPPATQPPPAPPRRSFAAVTVGLAFVATGTIALLLTLGVELPVTTLVPVLLILVGLGVVFSAIRGESSGGVLGFAVFLGVVLAIGSLLGAVLDTPIRGGVGERHHRPATSAELQDEYRLLMGTLVVDLRETEFGPGTTAIEASTVLGEVEVRLPEGIAVSVDSNVGGGSATILGVAEDGLSVSNDRRSDDYLDAERRLDLTVGVGLGEVTVTR